MGGRAPSASLLSGPARCVTGPWRCPTPWRNLYGVIETDAPVKGSASSLAVDVGAWFDGLCSRRPTIGLVVGVVRDGETRFHCSGVADIPSRAPMTADTVLRIASITKTFTAISVMQLWERGLVDLDAPANDYLRGYRLVDTDAGYGPATPRHLLTHTAGLPEVAHLSGLVRPNFGESVEAGAPIPTLAAFYGGALRVQAEPGTRFVYNNHGPATLGQLVEDVSGMPLAHYFREHIFEPLGMTDSDLVRSARVESRRATGYEIRGSGVETVDERDMVTAGAASAFSTPADMAKYLSALLGGGANEHGSILRPDTLASMFEPHHRPDTRIPGMGLGFFRTRVGHDILVGHQGTHPGFHSHIALAPDGRVGAMGFTNGAHQADFWLPAAVSNLVGRLAGLTSDEAPLPSAPRPERWSDLVGWYRLQAGLMDLRLRGMIGFGVEVFVRSGQLMVRFLTPVPALARGFPLVPDDPVDPDVMRFEPGDGMDPMRIVFGRDQTGAVDRVHLEVMPLTLPRGSSSANPRHWASGIAAVVGSAAVTRIVRSD